MRYVLLILSIWATNSIAALLPTPLSVPDWSQLAYSAYAKLPEPQQHSVAKPWGLTPPDYSHYLYLMQHTDNGLFYSQAHLDPSWILAINGKDKTEQHKFVVLAVQREHARLDKLLAFEKLFQDVQKELYPNQLPIAMPVAPLAKPAILNTAFTDRILFFTTLSAPDNTIIKKLLEKIQHAKAKLDIFLIGPDVTSAHIQQWALQHAIPPTLTQQGIITLNHDAGKYQQLTHGKASLPLVLVHRLGKLYVMDKSASP